MFPPGRVIFLRPIKLLDPTERGEKERGVKQEWDAIYTTPQEVIGEGILVSKKVGGGLWPFCQCVTWLPWACHHELRTFKHDVLVSANLNGGAGGERGISTPVKKAFIRSTAQRWWIMYKKSSM